MCSLILLLWKRLLIKLQTVEYKEKEKFTLCEQLVDKYGKTIPVQFISHFILNRQYRQWEVGVDSVSIPDTLVLKCNQSVYLIPRQLVAEAGRILVG